MKNFYMIGGTMGVGKTATCSILKGLLPNCVFLDGDWCWDMHPFVVNERTKAVVLDNICHMLNNFLSCGAFENVVFCWVLHEQSIIDVILSHIDICGWDVKNISLVCTEEELKNRLLRDVENGRRSADVMERSLPRLPLYSTLNTLKLDTTEMSAAEAAAALLSLL